MENFCAIIRRNFPDINIQSIQVLGEGRMSIAFLVNEQWVFRFPKNKEAGKDLEKEIKMMPKLAEQITIAIPRFQYVGKQDNGLPFVGYKMLPGELLGEEEFPSLPITEQRLIASQIAKFMKELGAFPVDNARQLGVPEVDLCKKFTNLFEQVKEIVFPFIEPDIRKYVTSRFQMYFNRLDNFNYSPALIHADLSPDHYVIDPKERNLTGIIDFGDLQITDPDYEYTYIFEDCGEDIACYVMQLRGVDDIERKLKKVSFFVTASHLATVLEGIEREEQTLIDEGLKSIRLEMEKR